MAYVNARSYPQGYFATRKIWKKGRNEREYGDMHMCRQLEMIYVDASDDFHDEGRMRAMSERLGFALQTINGDGGYRQLQRVNKTKRAIA